MKKTSFVTLLLLQSLYALPLATGKEVESVSKQYLGDPYVWGGTTPEKGMDCSGYTKYVFSRVGIPIPRTAYAQSKIGETVSKENLKKGDLLFFLTDKTRHIPITHVGIYLGNDKFIHAASSKKGIIISSIKEGHYSKVFKYAKRIQGKTASFKKNFALLLNEEAMRSSMDIKITSFGGANATF